jgi:hypothetical protein
VANSPLTDIDPTGMCREGRPCIRRSYTYPTGDASGGSWGNPEGGAVEEFSRFGPAGGGVGGGRTPQPPATPTTPTIPTVPGPIPPIPTPTPPGPTPQPPGPTTPGNPVTPKPWKQRAKSLLGVFGGMAIDRLAQSMPCGKPRAAVHAVSAGLELVGTFHAVAVSVSSGVVAVTTAPTVAASLGAGAVSVGFGYVAYVGAEAAAGQLAAVQHNWSNCQ